MCPHAQGYNHNAMGVQYTQTDILVWHKTLKRYADSKPYKGMGAQHLLGYLRRCADVGELQPDPHVRQWRECIKLIIRRTQSQEDELKLISLYYALETA